MSNTNVDVPPAGHPDRKFLAMARSTPSRGSGVSSTSVAVDVGVVVEVDVPVGVVVGVFVGVLVAV
jgi:hypothetical protein